MKTYRQSLTIFSLALFVCVMGATGASGAEYEGVKAAQIKRTTTASNGQKLQYLATEKPEITVLMVEIPAGGETGWHLHPVPVYAYMLSGAITVEAESGDKRDFREGDAIIEVMNTPHNGMNSGTIPAKLVVFYTGEQGSPNTVRVIHK
jgi:quercetin dioxygenase-like cupin family protein